MPLTPAKEVDGEFMEMEAKFPSVCGQSSTMKAKEQFGDERLQALLKQDLGDARQTSETIHKAVEEFVGDAEPSDDLTKMCIKMKSA